MKKVKVLMATNDELYCGRIEEYIQENGVPIEISVITEYDYFVYSDEKENADIVLVSLDFKDYVVEEFFRRPQVFFLAPENVEGDAYKYINPYQKTEILLREILLKYGELTGDASFLMEKTPGKKMIGFYSPCGGGGKTTLALALAETLAQEGKNVLYLNLDLFFCINRIFDEQEKGGFSQVLLALKQNTGNQFFVVASKNIKRGKMSRILYFSDLENPYDLEDIKEDEMERFLQQIIQMKEIDITIIDMESTLNLRTKKALEYSDVVFMPLQDSLMGRNKMESMIEAAKVSVLLENVLKKGTWIVNKANGHPKNVQNAESGYIVIPDLPAVGNMQRIDQIGAIMKNAVKDIRAKVMEGCE